MWLRFLCPAFEPLILLLVGGVWRGADALFSSHDWWRNIFPIHIGRDHIPSFFWNYRSRARSSANPSVVLNTTRQSVLYLALYHCSPPNSITAVATPPHQPLYFYSWRETFLGAIKVLKVLVLVALRGITFIPSLLCLLTLSRIRVARGSFEVLTWYLVYCTLARGSIEVLRLMYIKAYISRTVIQGLFLPDKVLRVLLIWGFRT